MNTVKRFFERIRLVSKKEKPTGTIAMQLACGKDKEAYEALSSLLKPEGLSQLISIEECEQKADKYEKDGDYRQAAIWVRLAIPRSLLYRDQRETREWFDRYQKLTGESPLGAIERPQAKGLKKLFKPKEQKEKDLTERVIQASQEYKQLTE